MTHTQCHTSPLLVVPTQVAVGIGADDIFVYSDAWRQSAALLPADVPLACRVSWTLRRAGHAMLVTSLTTAFAFASNIVNDVAAMQLFGMFMSLMVMFDYLYTVTWFPLVVTIYHLHFEGRPCCRPACPCRRPGCSLRGQARGGVGETLRGHGAAQAPPPTDAHEPRSDNAMTLYPHDDESAAVDVGRRERCCRDVVGRRVWSLWFVLVGCVLVLTVPMGYLADGMRVDEDGTTLGITMSC